MSSASFIYHLQTSVLEALPSREKDPSKRKLTALKVLAAQQLRSHVVPPFVFMSCRDI